MRAYGLDPVGRGVDKLDELSDGVVFGDLDDMRAYGLARERIRNKYGESVDPSDAGALVRNARD